MSVVEPAPTVVAWLADVERTGRSPHTVAAYRGDLAQYVRHLSSVGIRDLRDVDPGDVEEFVRTFAAQPGRGGAVRSDSTIARVVSAVRVFHRWCHEQRLTPDDPAASVPPPAAVRATPVVLEPDDVATLLASVEGETPIAIRDRAVLSLLAGTGIRAAEVVALDREHVEDDGRRVHVPGDRARPLPVPDPRALRTWVRDGRDELGDASRALFPNARGRRMRRQSVWRLVVDRAIAAGLPAGTSPRVLRATFAALERAAGTPEDVVLELLGRKPWTGVVERLHDGAPAGETDSEARPS